ncbi:GPI-linked NAD(P)(+)--arginine ADP-ribosyltransferase 1 isoform X1 [Alligator mississippiensis]|uniref:GPI-linked NAD(P)(+)--arginine ADP-ribosyltransferase 1 isoform X1 n=1 Tax=Alligator mississippiensis TaxID=8496 RepID=UPI0009075EC0|nr:GPI-linked NAD(P)(+)--arginine ADP-ribosyltransferase 1 isoform X1 [Alligator mississippiensis]
MKPAALPRLALAFTPVAVNPGVRRLCKRRAWIAARASALPNPHTCIVLTAQDVPAAPLTASSLCPQVLAFPLHRRDLFPIKDVRLDMAPSAFDDQYKGCVAMMEAELGALNRSEFSSNRVYAEAWTEAAAKWKEKQAETPVPPDLKAEHAIAIMAYTMQGPLHRDFNAAVREAGRTRENYLGSFNFKTLHFLLTRGLQALGNAQHPRCRKVYRGVKGVRFLSERRQTVRFGHFTSSSLRNTSALQFGQDTFFCIQTCHGAGIRNFSIFPTEDEVLIPPFETFTVKNFTRAGDRTLIELGSLDKSSSYNCEFVKEKRCKTQRCTFSSAAGASSASWSLFLLWGFLVAASTQVALPS